MRPDAPRPAASDLGIELERLRAMARCEWRVREQSSLFGFLWTLLQPLLLFLVLLLVFTRWLGPRSPDFPAQLLIGVVHYGFFSSATLYACTALRRRRGIVLNFPVPCELIVLSSVFSVAASFLLELAVLAPIIAALGHPPTWSWVAVPFIAGMLVVGVAGLCLALAAVGARFPDFERVWAIAVQAGFFLTPVFYRMSDVSPSHQHLIGLNPLARLIETARVALLYGRLPDAGGAALGAAAAAALAAAGWALFRSQRAHYGDDVAV
ncbi:MAG: ABC transporter permease [Elusimicrobiota bacterium]|nr:ABC transporter permease [Elusimicrobiota bacterium]